ncbi:MAG: DUF2892 domain-containing protein [Saprospiraceae bacterium]|nr:DUF2892 domain-containing protein [Saprospiraceae bacterium]
MKKNMGNVDRLIRTGIAILIVALYMTNQISGLAASVALILGAVFLLTSYLKFCPLYLPFGISTLKEEDKNDEN